MRKENRLLVARRLPWITRSHLLYEGVHVIQSSARTLATNHFLWEKCLLLSNMVPFVIEYDRIHVYCVCILHVFLPVSGNILAYPSDTPDTRIRCVSEVYLFTVVSTCVSTVATKIREDMPPDMHRRFPLGWAKSRRCIHFCILR